MSEWSTGRNLIVSIRTNCPGAASLVRVTYRKWIRNQLLESCAKVEEKKEKSQKEIPSQGRPTIDIRCLGEASLVAVTTGTKKSGFGTQKKN